jgi:ribosomal protein S18 acetylase RimI-like enzyme
VAEWVVEPLDRTHERSFFSCGNSPLDDFLRQLVSQYEKRRLGRTYVALRPPEKRVVGYYTLASGRVLFASLPPAHGKKLPRHPVPVVLLARLAVAIEAQGRGLGQFLLVDALHRCHELSERLGVHAVEVEAIDDDAKRFYEKYGFVALADDGHHLYLPIETIRKGLAGR